MTLHPKKTITNDELEKDVWRSIATHLLSRLDLEDQSFILDEVIQTALGDGPNTIVTSHPDGGKTLRVRLVSNVEADPKLKLVEVT